MCVRLSLCVGITSCSLLLTPAKELQCMRDSILLISWLWPAVRLGRTLCRWVALIDAAEPHFLLLKLQRCVISQHIFVEDKAVSLYCILCSPHCTHEPFLKMFVSCHGISVTRPSALSCCKNYFIHLNWSDKNKDFSNPNEIDFIFCLTHASTTAR